MNETAPSLLDRFWRGLRKLVSEPYDWFVLVGDRLVVAGLLTGAFALVLGVLAATGAVTVTETSNTIYLAQALIGSDVTLVTIVLAVNQLVLSQEFRTPGELEDHIHDVIAYRNRVEEVTGRDTVPVTPSDFLTILLDGTRMAAQRLGGIVEGRGNDRLVEEVDDLVSTVTAHSDHIEEVLGYSQGGIFSTLAVTLDTNYSRQIHEARRIQAEYDEELSPTAYDAIDDLVESLHQVDVARQYFKSLYVQTELTKLSRSLLYAGLPAVGGAIVLFLLYVDGPSSAVPPVYLTALTLLVVTLGFALLAILFSYVLRIAVVAQRTVAITPFTTPEQQEVAGGMDIDPPIEQDR